MRACVALRRGPPPPPCALATHRKDGDKRWRRMGPGVKDGWMDCDCGMRDAKSANIAPNYSVLSQQYRGISQQHSMMTNRLVAEERKEPGHTYLLQYVYKTKPGRVCLIQTTWQRLAASSPSIAAVHPPSQAS